MLITGASSGIGRALSVELGRRGASLGLLARRAEALEELVTEVEGAGGQALILHRNARRGDGIGHGHTTKIGGIR